MSRPRTTKPLDVVLAGFDRASDTCVALFERAWRSSVVRILRLVAGARVLWLLMFLGAAGVVVAPEIAVRRARARATACLARARSLRGPQLPDCSYIVRDFDWPTSVSYTRHDATYRAEELLARVAMNRYLDAAVGEPNPRKLAAAASVMRRAQEMMDNGSRRISFEELGPSVGAPHFGKMASAIGDRTGLMSMPDYFGLWYTRRDVLEASLIEADFEVVDEIAGRFASFHPSDADLKTATGAALCITDPERGFEVLKDVAPARAQKRSENMQRNFGEVFALAEACAAKAGEGPLGLPAEEGAGVGDVPILRRLVELRTTVPGPERDSRVTRAVELLRDDGLEALDRDQPFARAMLVASVFALTSEPIDPPTAARIVTPRPDSGEGPLAPRAATLRTILVRPPGAYPIVPAAWLEATAGSLSDLSAIAREPDATALKRAASSMFILAAIEHATNGDLEPALACAAGWARWGEVPPRLSALSAASAAYVAGDPARALHILDGAPPFMDGGQDDDDDVDLALSTLEALVAASSGDAARAQRVAGALPTRAKDAADPDLILFARWVALAVGPLRSGDGPGEAPRLASTGQADRTARYRELGEQAIDATLRAWSRAMVAPADERRLFRYAVFDHSGDIPSLALPTLVAGARLLDDGTSSDGVEIWLDAMSAVDSRRMRLRSYAWMRLEAARIRGDASAAQLWSDRLDVLREVARQEDDLEATRFLRF